MTTGSLRPATRAQPAPTIAAPARDGRAGGQSDRAPGEHSMAPMNFAFVTVRGHPLAGLLWLAPVTTAARPTAPALRGVGERFKPTKRPNAQDRWPPRW